LVTSRTHRAGNNQANHIPSKLAVFTAPLTGRSNASPHKPTSRSRQISSLPLCLAILIPRSPVSFKVLLRRGTISNLMPSARRFIRPSWAVGLRIPIQSNPGFRECRPSSVGGCSSFHAPFRPAAPLCDVFSGAHRGGFSFRRLSCANSRQNRCGERRRELPSFGFCPPPD